jgi:hypothetical protein
VGAAVVAKKKRASKRDVDVASNPIINALLMRFNDTLQRESEMFRELTDAEQSQLTATLMMTAHAILASVGRLHLIMQIDAMQKPKRSVKRRRAQKRKVR